MPNKKVVSIIIHGLVFFLFLLRSFYVKIKYLHIYLGKVNFSLKTDVVLCLPQYCFNGSYLSALLERIH